MLVNMHLVPRRKYCSTLVLTQWIEQWHRNKCRSSRDQGDCRNDTIYLAIRQTFIGDVTINTIPTPTPTFAQQLPRSRTPTQSWGT